MKNRWTMPLSALLALALAMLCPALAEEMPADVAMLVPNAALEQDSPSAAEAGGVRLYRVTLPDTGERVEVLIDAAGEAVFAETVRAATVGDGAATVERSRAEELVCAMYPDCRILFAEDVPSGKRVCVVGEGYWGSVIVAEEGVCSRSLAAGEMYSNGRLTLYGALRALELYRPEAQLRALELDEDDGYWLYEGEALLYGEIYEFELDASTGRLLEWERD